MMDPELLVYNACSSRSVAALLLDGARNPKIRPAAGTFRPSTSIGRSRFRKGRDRARATSIRGQPAYTVDPASTGARRGGRRAAGGIGSAGSATYEARSADIEHAWEAKACSD